MKLHHLEDRELDALLLERNPQRLEEFTTLLLARTQEIQAQLHAFKQEQKEQTPDADRMLWYRKARTALLHNMNAYRRLKAALSQVRNSPPEKKKVSFSQTSPKPKASRANRQSPIIGKLIQYRCEYQRPKPSVVEIEFLRRELFAMVDALLLLSRPPTKEALLWQADEEEQLGEKVFASLTSEEPHLPEHLEQEVS